MALTLIQKGQTDWDIPLNANFEAIAAAEPRTVYVAASGSDTDGDGTAAAPYATLQKAVDECPIVNTGMYLYTVMINESGNYAGFAMAERFIVLHVAEGVTAKITSPIYLRNESFLSTDQCKGSFSIDTTASGEDYGVVVTHDSNAILTTGLTAIKANVACVRANDASSAIVGDDALENGTVLSAEYGIYTSHGSTALSYNTSGSCTQYAYFAQSSEIHIRVGKATGGVAQDWSEHGGSVRRYDVRNRRIPLASGVTGDDRSQMSITPEGMVSLVGFLTPESSIAASAVVYKLPEGYRPRSNFYCIALGNNVEPNAIYINTTGEIQVSREVPAGNRLYFNVTYSTQPIVE